MGEDLWHPVEEQLHSGSAGLGFGSLVLVDLGDVAFLGHQLVLVLRQMGLMLGGLGLLRFELELGLQDP